MPVPVFECDPIEAQLEAEKDAIIGCMQTAEFRAAATKFVSKK